MNPSVPKELTGDLLKQVSRSFYLSLRVLPREIRPQISLAYLLARATDTIADTDAVSRERRVACLRELQSLSRVPELGTLAQQQALPAERVLLEHLEDCLAMLDSFGAEDKELIRSLLVTITSGQIFDLERFPEGKLTALANDEELDRYTYMVAGCVGEFWTKMCQAHLPGMEKLNLEDAIRFGKGLQLVNILRDMPKDYALGRCYLPVREPKNLMEVQPVFEKWLDTAVAHLDAGWRYTLAIPASRSRLRLACIWPIWIGVRTIALLREKNPLDAAQRIKVRRGEVYRLMMQSLWLRRCDTGLDKKYRQLRSEAVGQI